MLLLVLLLLLPLRAGAADLLADAAGGDAGTIAAVERRIQLLLVHRLAGDTAALASDVDELAARDQAHRAAGRPRTGLTDDARYLAAGAAPTRDLRRRLLDELLDASPDPEVRRLAEHRLETDDAATADRLLRDDRHNRRAAVLNDAVRPLGVFSGAAFLAALNPLLLAGSAVDSVVTTAVNLWHYDRLSTPEREALARYRTQIEREPRTADAPGIVRAVQRLGRKRAEALCAETIRLGTKALDADDVERASYYLGSARRLDGCATDAEEPAARADELRARHAARREAGRWPVVEPAQPRPGLQALDYAALATAVALAEPGAMVEAASRFRERYDDDFADTARYVIAVARDLAGHRAEARTALAELAGNDSPAGRRAEDILGSAAYSPLDALDEAERRHTRDRLRYVFLGGRMDGRTALYGATHLGAEGVRAAQSLGIFNALGVATRAWQTWRKDPVSNQAIIDRGEELLARQPESPDAARVHDTLADAYERAGSYGRALMHYKATPDPSPKRVAGLEGKLADELLREAERDGGNPLLLDAITRSFAGTKAAEKARARLGDHPVADGGTVVPREVLEAAPSLLGPAGLDLEPTLLDGDPGNGELADAGVRIRDGGLELTLRDGDGERRETRPRGVEAVAQARAAAHEALYARLLTADRRDPETGRFERYVPFFLQGELGQSGGVYVYPGVKMRRYRTPDPTLYE